MARSTGDEGGAKAPARGRRARRPWRMVTLLGGRAGVHGLEPGEAEGVCDGHVAGGLDSLALL